MEPLVIISGAGTGKTTVMQARVLWLVGSGQVRPDQVLGLTFTNKAAAVLATRIQQSLWKLQDGLAAGASDNHGLLMTEPEPTVSTYHSYAANIVSRHGLRIGIEPDARLLDQPLRFQLASNVVRYTKLPIRYLEKKVADIAG
ncbi:MAG: AAA family ATPase, partial [Actinobacteria bacterium]|nr:AAA family ATPase [Actinomycetota bacterium]